MNYENLRPAEKAREIMKQAKGASTDKVYAALVEEAMNAAARGLQELSLYWETCELRKAVAVRLSLTGRLQDIQRISC